MTTEKTLAETLAESRANGQRTFSAAALFPAPAQPAWAALKLDWYVRFLYLCLGLYFVSLYFLWQRFLGTTPFSLDSALGTLVAAAGNYFVLILLSCKIQDRMQAAGLQKHGWGTALFWGLMLNPFILGWSVPVFVLLRVAATKRRLGAPMGAMRTDRKTP